jgi:hypothetical protein
MSNFESGTAIQNTKGRLRGLRLPAVLGAILLLLPSPAIALPGDDKAPAGKDATKKESGADAPKSADRELLEQLLQQIQLLQTRVAELEAKDSAHPAAVSPDAAPATSTASAPASASPAPPAPTASVPIAPHPADIEVNEVSPRLHMNVYADAGYSANDQGKGANSFDVGSLDMFLSSRLSDHISVLGEFLLLAQPDNTIEPDLERLMLEYKHNDYFTFGIGRYHTDIGYYNATFHHIQWFATPIGRPLMFRFDDDGGFLPLQEIGLSMNGNIPSGKLGLHWVAQVGNGRDHDPDHEPAQNRVDFNHGKSFNINVSSHPAWFSGVIAGFSFYHDDLTPPEVSKVGQSIMDAYVVYQNQRLEWLNEILDVRNAVQGGRTFDTPGFYSQISYAFGKYRPYFRYSWVNSNDADPVFGPDANEVAVSRENDASAGVRIDINSLAALKFQYDRFSQRELKSYNQISSQVSFSF